MWLKAKKILFSFIVKEETKRVNALHFKCFPKDIVEKIENWNNLTTN